MNARRTRSKRRSAGSRRQPRPAVFFIDHCLGRLHVAEAIRQRGYRVELLADCFDKETFDQDWLRDVGDRGWIVLTKDKHFR
jgi:hypothetical protein